MKTFQDYVLGESSLNLDVKKAKEQALAAAYKLSLNGPGKEVFVRNVLPLQEDGLPEKAKFEVFSKATGRVGLIAISKLTAIQDRVDLSKVNEYIDALALGHRFPPVKILHSGGKVFLLDGHHRVVAARLLGLRTVNVEDIT